MTHFDRQKEINSVNGNSMAHEADKEKERVEKCDTTSDWEVCDDCKKTFHYKHMLDGQCETCVLKELGY